MADRQNFVEFKPNQGLSEHIASHIQEQIVRGELLSCDRIQESRVVEYLRVSRGSVREAFRILDPRRLVEILPRRSVVVSNLNSCRLHDVVTYVEIFLGHITKDSSESWSDQKTKHLERALIDPKADYGWLSPGRAFLAIAEKHANRVFFESYADLKPTIDRIFAKLLRKKPCQAQVFEPLLLNRLLPAFKRCDTSKKISLIHEICQELERRYLESLERTGWVSNNN